MNKREQDEFKQLQSTNERLRRDIDRLQHANIVNSRYAELLEDELKKLGWSDDDFSPLQKQSREE